MKSVTQALNLFMTALGSWLMIPLLIIVNSNPNDEWVPTNLDDGHLEDYFFLLAALMVANEILFIRVCRGYKYMTTAELEALDAGIDRGTNTGNSTSSSQSATIRNVIDAQADKGEGKRV